MEAKKHATKQRMNHWKIKGEIKKYLETNENENTMIQDLWDIAKTVLRGKFIEIQDSLGKQEKSPLNHLTLHLKELQKKSKQNPKLVEGKIS